MGDPFSGAEQITPQSLQLDVSVLVSTHEPLQSVFPSPHPSVEHDPERQTDPAAHGSLHLPQCDALLRRSTQTPLQFV
jgi:hypothetical protein